ncbi:helix-turn-helix domain-containing protein [Burkholderia multivorans]|uniref:helix-turn-helix domain-containing protein n=1 Tax=Burkholderia multivorans TaxID=87883 RepID=UPI00201880ED|nr:helix-turn-helix domain-containing protein [Burkholderia multivorans]MCO1343393.1 helix-turn-helix domain-containing protein [Burkholderia multivorans]MCO1443855.1 helix-turn-helix domain-containing protein [Burkholderia multivorans]MDR8920313.1 hypothetical protein [Burkholderia multivorans]MDR8926711.1 hypothetical protein [Burkholderia multivorans]MDR8969645.1 hypothetical protein [Burkholderia multivorans]
MSDQAKLERALTLKEAAELLRVSYSTVYAHKESLGFFKVGGAWRVWPETLRDLGSRTTDSGRNADGGRNIQGRSATLPQTSRVAWDDYDSARKAAIELDKLLQKRPDNSRRGPDS